MIEDDAISYKRSTLNALGLVLKTEQFILAKRKTVLSADFKKNGIEQFGL